MKELGLQMPVINCIIRRKPALWQMPLSVSVDSVRSGGFRRWSGICNHHCGFSSIQQHSSVEHDYLKDGFVARNLGEELPNPELYVRFLLLRTEMTMLACALGCQTCSYGK